MNRRSFLKGLIVAPTIVRVSSLMPIRMLEATRLDIIYETLTLDTYSDYVLRPMVDRLAKCLEHEILWGNQYQETKGLFYDS